jgi:hypothetical protein
MKTLKSKLLDAPAVLMRVAGKVPAELRGHLVVIGSIAAAFAYQSIPGGKSEVATKDIDVLIRPAMHAVATAEELSAQLLSEGWTPRYPDGQARAASDTPVEKLPALRLSPPGETEGWFLELLAEPLPDQQARRAWRGLTTSAGRFGIPSFRYLSVCLFGAEVAQPSGLRVAAPPSMALANLLEHSDPDRTSFQGTASPRFAKDVGRSVSLYWMAEQHDVHAADVWERHIRECIASTFPARSLVDVTSQALKGLDAIDDIMLDAHTIAARTLLAPFGISQEDFRRTWGRLHQLLRRVGQPNSGVT